MVVLSQILIILAGVLYYLYLITTPEEIKRRSIRPPFYAAPPIMYAQLVRQREIITTQAYVIIGETIMLAWIFYILVVVR